MSEMGSFATVRRNLGDVWCTPHGRHIGGGRLCRDGPITEVSRSFDHLVGASEQHGWHDQADRLGGLEIDDEFKPRWLFDGQIA